MLAVWFPPRSELRRPSDRYETATRWAALVVLVLITPLLAACGGARTQQVRDDAAAVRATAHQVEATVIGVSSASSTTADGQPSYDLSVTVRWIEPVGALTAPQVAGGVGPRIGDPWPLWVAPDLTPVAPPATERDAEIQGAVTSIGVLIGAGVALAAAVALVRRMLDRQRMRQWDEDWLAFRRRRNRGAAG
ncbi:hypothetical protein [Actinomycetospora sp.]|uniref:Rv1733c family protein n=1 Tax=Actinomycetospora sp. TaxID=1872135 RepID=UPI002F3E5C5F